MVLADLLIEVQSAERAVQDDLPFLEQLLKAEWRGARTDFVGLQAVAAWLISVRAVTPGASDQTIAKLLTNRENIPAYRSYLSGALPDICLLYTSPSPRDQRGSRMPSSA